MKPKDFIVAPNLGTSCPSGMESEARRLEASLMRRSKVKTEEQEEKSDHDNSRRRNDEIGTTRVWRTDPRVWGDQSLTKLGNWVGDSQGAWIRSVPLQ